MLNKKILGLCLMTLCLSCSPKNQAKEASQSATGKAYYGGEPQLKTEAVSLSQAVEKKQFAQKFKLKGSIAKVCQKKGCWMIIQDGKTTARITFKDYSFFVPKDIQGKEVFLEGALTVKTLSEKDARHFAEDEGAAPEVIASIKGPQSEYSYLAESVSLPQT